MSITIYNATPQTIKIGAGVNKPVENLPELSNPATAKDILDGKQSINANGGIIVGTYKPYKLPTLNNPAPSDEIFLGREVIDKNGDVLVGTYEPFELPTLDSPAIAEDIAKGKEAIDGQGNIIVGTLEQSSGENPFAELNYKIYSTQSTQDTYDIPKEYFGGVTALATNAFYHKYGLRSIDISEMTSIGGNAFYQCTSLIEIVGTNIKTLASQICNNCTALKKAYFPEFAGTVSTMFANCTALEEVDFPKATSYGANCFKGLTALKRLVIPATVKTIGANALNCGSTTNKTTFIFESDTPPTIQANTFIAENTEKIVVNKGRLDAYRTATNYTIVAHLMEEKAE